MKPAITILQNFIDYLINQIGVSKNTLKFYKSDLSHFTAWLILRLRTYGVLVDDLSGASSFVTNKIAQEYKDYLIANNAPQKSINRRLSTCRHFGKFLYSNGHAQINFMDGIGNVSSNPRKTVQGLQNHPVIGKFEKHLEAQKVSKVTIKNYLSDIKQFIAFLETQNG